MKTSIGISESDRVAIAEGLGRLLADTYSLSLKTHAFHWNVTGPHFYTLHSQFEAQYSALSQAVDLVAERIRALGLKSPGTCSEFSRLTRIPEAQPNLSAARMVEELLNGQETVIRTARELFPLVEKARDQVTADLLTQRLENHEKMAWMLRSFLEGHEK